MLEFRLPEEIIELKNARDRLRDRMNSHISATGSDVQLSLTFDGNLVGDIGEALAAYLFGVRLVENKSNPGIDGYVDGRSVQVKATGTGRGPAFTYSEAHADLLLFFDLDFTDARGLIVFNGPEHYVRSYLPDVFVKQRALSRSQIREADRRVKDSERLARIR